MNEVSSKHILSSLDATSVRLYFERILSMEVQILQTLGLSPHDRRSVSAACAHVAVSFFSNVQYNFKVSGKNEATFPTLKPKSEFNRVKLDGVVYNAQSSHICQMLWVSAVATRYNYAGSATTINVKEMMAERSSAILGIKFGALMMKEWRAEADDIVDQYVEDHTEQNIISILLDAVGVEHEDADNQSAYGSLYTLAHECVNDVSSHWRSAERKEAVWIQKCDVKHKMNGELYHHRKTAWTGENCLPKRGGHPKWLRGLQVCYYNLSPNLNTNPNL
jgi:hypothetical protein